LHTNTPLEAESEVPSRIRNISPFQFYIAVNLRFSRPLTSRMVVLSSQETRQYPSTSFSHMANVNCGKVFHTDTYVTVAVVMVASAGTLLWT